MITYRFYTIEKRFANIEIIGIIKSMNNQTISSNDYQIFSLKILFLLGFAWAGFISSLAGFFYAPLIWTLVIIAGIWMTRNALHKGISLRPSRELIFASSAFLLVATTFSIFSTPSVFTGRDQGSFTEAAIRLSQNHKLEFSTSSSAEFFKLRTPGRSLNFPGFYYTRSGNLITQFSLVYISWLALFFAVFGTVGLIIANGVLFFTFLLSFYLLARLFLKASSTIPLMLFVSTSFVLMWFSKFTLSENMALPLLWLTILFLMLFLKKQETSHYVIFLLSAFLLCFSRIEGFAFLFVSLAIVLINKDTRNFIKEKMMNRFFLPATFLLLVFIANMISDIYFYKEIVKALLPSVSVPKATYIGQLKNNILPDFYTVKIFYLYGLLGFFIIGAIGVITTFWKKEFYKLMPLLVVAPTFFYFFSSQITPDHPWMLRRFMFSLLPVAIFYSGLLLGQWLEKKSDSEKSGVLLRFSSGVIVVVLIAMNLPAFSKYLTFSENKGLLEQTQALSEQFSDNDLILIDREASGDGWSMISGPMNFLHGKNAIYFFNTQDLSKLDLNKFENVYLIVSNEKVQYYLNSTISSRLTEIKDYNLNSTKLDIKPASALQKMSLPEKKEFAIHGKIFKVSK
ncbi:MAG: hypothetical protein ACD_67C00003G0002 [uncultured bacterium]|nr:MAG: hypothetical protein ACD_67C00003G0002 [uncultured bacterium]